MIDAHAALDPAAVAILPQTPSKRPGVFPAHYRGELLQKVGRKDRINPRLVCLLVPRSATAESYYRLRHAVESLGVAEQGLVIGVTSANAGDGKTLTAINLAGALAQDRAASVLLVDLDLRKPGVGSHEYLDLQSRPGPGVADWIRNPELAREQITHYVQEFNLYLVHAGSAVESPYELLKSARLAAFLEQARQHHDFVILDTSHVLDSPDMQLLSKNVDGFLLVIKADHTPAKNVEDALNLMEADKVLGVVFNGSSTPN